MGAGADLIVRGLREGFRIGFFDFSEFGSTMSCDRTMRSALEHQNVVDEYLAEERSAATSSAILSSYQQLRS